MCVYVCVFVCVFFAFMLMLMCDSKAGDMKPSITVGEGADDIWSSWQSHCLGDEGGGRGRVCALTRAAFTRTHTHTHTNNETKTHSYISPSTFKHTDGRTHSVMYTCLQSQAHTFIMFHIQTHLHARRIYTHNNARKQCYK